ncbi:hypothetical protein AAHH86_00135 [Candidatus Hodgkinia cicadicola]
MQSFGAVRSWQNKLAVVLVWAGVFDAVALEQVSTKRLCASGSSVQYLNGAAVQLCYRVLVCFFF